VYDEPLQAAVPQLVVAGAFRQAPAPSQVPFGPQGRLGLAAQPPKYIERADQSVPLEIRTAAFGAPKPTLKPIYEDVALKNGDAAVFDLSAVREDPSDSKQQEAALRGQIAKQIASSEAQSYAAAALADAKVTLNPQAID